MPCYKNKFHWFAGKKRAVVMVNDTIKETTQESNAMFREYMGVFKDYLHLKTKEIEAHTSTGPILQPAQQQNTSSATQEHLMKIVQSVLQNGNLTNSETQRLLNTLLKSLIEMIKPGE